jgi:hypothetical protein
MLYDPKWESETKPVSAVKNLLIQARSLIEKEENWCQGTQFKAKPDGGLRYCALGAIWERSDNDLALATEAQRAVEFAMNGVPITFYNDFSTHVWVVAAFDKAIAAVD